MRPLHDTFLRPEDEPPLTDFQRQWTNVFGDIPPAEQLQSDLQPDEPLRFFRGTALALGFSVCLWCLGIGAYLVLFQ